jgi:tRNA-binding EMAP/Myf-like protein
VKRNINSKYEASVDDREATDFKAMTLTSKDRHPPLKTVLYSLKISSRKLF